jgi:hypothetical protein
MANSPEQHVASQPKATDHGVMASISEGFSHFTSEIHEAWNHVTLNAPTEPMAHFAKAEPPAGVSEHGLDFHAADAAAGGLYASNIGKPSSSGVRNADKWLNDLDQQLAA